MTSVLLLNPPYTMLGYREVKNFASRSFPLGLGMLSGTLKTRGIPFKVLDADAFDMSIAEIINFIGKVKPKIVGLSSYTSHVVVMHSLIAEIKKNNKETVVVVGGHHAFAVREKLFDECECDIVAVGEGEILFAEICEAILNGQDLATVKGIIYKNSGKYVSTGIREYVENIDNLPMPSYTDFPMDKYVGHFYRKWISGYRKPFCNIMTSRGCPFSCGFCSNILWGKKVRFQSAERVLADIDFLVKNFGIKILSFFDDTFTLDKDRANKICDALIEKDYKLDLYCSTRVNSLDEALIKKMAKSGFKWIGIGIESGNGDILKKISKGQTPEKCSKILHLIAENGIAIYGSFILGYPGETKRTLNDTLRFILSNPIHFPQINIFVPYPGTPVYNELVNRGVDIQKNVSQLDKVSSYNESISPAYLQFFLWYSYFRSLVRIKYLKLANKTFKFKIVVKDFLRMLMAMLILDRKKREKK